MNVPCSTFLSPLPGMCCLRVLILRTFGTYAVGCFQGCRASSVLKLSHKPGRDANRVWVVLCESVHLVPRGLDALEHIIELAVRCGEGVHSAGLNGLNSTHDFKHLGYLDVAR